MVGNSWLAMSQYYIAALKPPHLTCIAPWEGAGDQYRETICRGGIPWPNFFDAVLAGQPGKGRVEDVKAEVQKCVEIALSVTDTVDGHPITSFGLRNALQWKRSIYPYMCWPHTALESIPKAV
jgi:hypothetical protein